MTDRDRNSTSEGPPKNASRRVFMHSSAVAGVIAGLTGLGALSVPGLARAADGSGVYPSHPKWRFVFINHVTTNPFFVPTRYGAADACGLLGCTYQWTGSQTSIASQMVNAMNTAIAAHVDGVAVAMVDPVAFNKPTERALKAGIPVVSYNAKAPAPNQSLAYIGQSLFGSGKVVGKRLLEHADSGNMVGFIATPGQLNIQPRMDGVAAVVKASGKNVKLHQIASGATINEEFSRVEAYYLGHKDVKIMFAVDAGSTAAVANVMTKYDLAKKGVISGGWDLLPQTLDAIKAGNLGFTLDQQPYLQGFVPIQELFQFKVSGSLIWPANVNTGRKFVTQSTVGPYLATKNRYEGSSGHPLIVPRSGAIV